MTTPGGAGTYPMRKRSFLRARRIGFTHRVGVCLVCFPPALRFAPPRCPWHSPTPVYLMYRQGIPVELYIRNIIPDDVSILCLEHLANRGGAMQTFAPA
jgi:hypothetical protein